MQHSARQDVDSLTLMVLRYDQNFREVEFLENLIIHENRLDGLALQRLAVCTSFLLASAESFRGWYYYL